MNSLWMGATGWCICVTVFFRHALLSSFTTVIGDDSDGRLATYLHDHLFEALRGRASFLSPSFYYPQMNTLGFTDAFLLDAGPYSILRWIGLDAFVSLQLVFIGLSLLCFLSSQFIGMRYLKLSPAIAICAAALITFPNNLYYAAAVGHTQFFALYYLPVIVLLVLLGLEDFPRLGARSLTCIAVAAALFGLLFATAFYVAWLFALTVLIALCTIAVLRRSEVAVLVRGQSKSLTFILATAALGFGIGLIPFVLIYFPVLSLVPGRGYRELLFFSPLPSHIINVGGTNLIWGWLLELMGRDPGVERGLAVTPGMTAIFLTVAYLLLRRSSPERVANSWRSTFVLTSLAVWAGSWLLTLKIGAFSFYWFIYHMIPGASAIRATGRIQLLVNLWIVAGLAVLLQSWINQAPAHWRRNFKAAVGGLLLLCLVEQLNVMSGGGLPRSRELAMLASIPAPPAECHAFLLRVDHPVNAVDEVDAMWISHQAKLPTINGSSSWTPPGWHLYDHSLDYYDAARQWIALKGVQQVCLYDRAERSWSAFI